MLDLTRRMDNLHDDLRSSFTSELRPITAEVSRLESLFLDVVTGTAPVRLNFSFPARSGISVAGMEPTSALEPTEKRPASACIMTSKDSVSDAPVYQMSRAVATITDLWREWKHGLGSCPSVESLERDYGTTWCTGKHDRRFFNRRKLIIHTIEARAESLAGNALDNAGLIAQQFEEYRLNIKKSIDWVSKNLPTFISHFK